MTGLELLEGLSFVDEKFIAEADTAKLGRNVPWMKVLSVAACLCILIVGVFALENFGHKGAMKEAAAPAAPAATQAAASLAPAEGEIPESAEEPSLTDELQHIPYAKLRVVKMLEDGSFEAVAEATQPMEMDTLVTVVVDPSKVPGAEATIADAVDVAEGTLFEIYDGAYDASRNILYVAELIC